MSTAVLSVRVRRELKEEVEALGLDVKSIVERALEEEVTKRRLQESRELAAEALDAMSEVSVEEWVRAVRETRHER